VGTGAEFIDLGTTGGFSWIAHPDEWMKRASAALVVEDATFLVDPVDTPELDERLAGSPPVRGVIRLLDRHGRDGDAVAARMGVPLIAGYDRPGRLHPELIVFPVADGPGWHEAAIWIPRARILMVAEAVGTVEYFLARSGDPLGVHPVIRLVPPRRAFTGLDPLVIAVGHGAPLIRDDAGSVLERTLASARCDIPRAWAHIVRRAWIARRSRSDP